MKNTIWRVFGYFVVCVAITLVFASLGAAGVAESATVLVTDSATGVKHLPGFTVDVIATGLPEVGDLTIGEQGDLIASQQSECRRYSGNLFRITGAGVVTTVAAVPRGQGVHPDTLSRDLFFSDECFRHILRVTPSGNVLFADVGGSTEGVDVRTDGTVYVSRRDAILRIDRNRFGDAASVSTLVYFKDIPGLQGKFDAIAFEKLADGTTGDLFAINEFPNGRILRINPDTGSTSLFSEYSGSGEALEIAPLTAAQATGPGHLFVSYQNAVTRISPDGRSVETFAEIPGSSAGVTVDNDGLVYIANTSEGLIYRLTPPPDPISISRNIRPGSCSGPLNSSSTAMFSVLIMGTPGFDVSLIDPGSIRLEGAAPVAWDLSDRGRPSVGCAASGPDGALDLALMFRAQDIVSGINPVQDLELRVLRLTGSLRPHAGKKPIKGEDVIVLKR